MGRLTRKRRSVRTKATGCQPDTTRTTVAFGPSFTLTRSLSSQVIDWVKVTEKTDEFIRLEMAMLPELHPGKFLYKYYPERENLRVHFWCYGVEGAGDGQIWDSIDVIVHVYPFGKFSRAILTENFTYCKGQIAQDATPLFAGVGQDIINRVKVRRERNK